MAAHFPELDRLCKVQSCLCRLVKAGLLDKKYAKRFSMISAWAELIGYVGNVTLNSLRIAASVDRELMLTKELVRRKKVCANQHDTTDTVVCCTVYAAGCNKSYVVFCDT